jgi:hypothetical protein
MGTNRQGGDHSTGNQEHSFFDTHRRPSCGVEAGRRTNSEAQPIRATRAIEALLDACGIVMDIDVSLVPVVVLDRG